MTLPGTLPAGSFCNKQNIESSKTYFLPWDTLAQGGKDLLMSVYFCHGLNTLQSVLKEHSNKIVTIAASDRRTLWEEECQKGWSLNNLR